MPAIAMIIPLKSKDVHVTWHAEIPPYWSHDYCDTEHHWRNYHGYWRSDIIGGWCHHPDVASFCI
jgi:hypothetical protein